MSAKSIRAGLTIGAVALATKSSFACAVCSVTSEKARYAYYATTAFMSLLPILMIGGVVYYIAKKGR